MPTPAEIEAAVEAHTAVMMSKPVEIRKATLVTKALLAEQSYDLAKRAMHAALEAAEEARKPII